ncbi:hypothetical protein FRC04_002134 [Tulasnella sp. 424]|nr:hypothetical protein FRC04_002134 [Tulasnella sp. 424]
MSRSDHSNPSSSDLDRDLAFYSGLTFVLEPKRKSAAPSEQSLQSVITKLDQNATTTKDPRSKNHWLRVTDGIAAAKTRRLMRRNSDFGDFTVREIRPGSAEETRIRLYITKWLASATSQPPSIPDLDESQPSTPGDANPPEDDITQSVGKRRRSRRLAGPHQDIPAPPDTSAPNEPSVAGPSREKRKATRVFSERDEALADGLGSSSFPELSILERPQKRVKFNLDLSTLKFFEEWDDLERRPSSSHSRGALTTAPTVKDLPSTCLQSIFIHGTPILL